MKILIFESYPTNFSREKIALEELGHSVTLFNPYLHKKNYKNKVINSAFNQLPDGLIYYHLNKSLKKLVNTQVFDLMIVYYGKEIHPDTLLYIKTKIPVLINWNGDELFNKLNNNQFLIDSIPLYDIHCSPRHHLKDEYLSKGVKNFIEVDWYYKSIIKNPTYEKPIYNGNFIGSWSPKREKIISRINDSTLLLHGWGWTKKSKCIDKQLRPLLGEEDMNKIFSQSKISINILTDENRDFINFRNYEIPSQYGFQISEKSTKILEVFEENINIVCFENGEELNEKYNYYLKHDTERQKIVSNSYNFMKDNRFDLKHQLAKVLDILK